MTRFSGAARRWALAVAVGLLLIGALALNQGRARHADAQRQLAAAEESHRQAVQRQARSAHNQALLNAAAGLQQRAQAALFMPQQWGERQINVRQQQMLRQEANQMLLGTVRHPGQVMQLEEFELSVTQADEGLFDTPANVRQPVLLTLRGLTYFRLAQQ